MDRGVERTPNSVERWRSGRISRNLCFETGAKGWRDEARRKS